MPGDSQKDSLLGGAQGDVEPAGATFAGKAVTLRVAVDGSCTIEQEAKAGCLSLCTACTPGAPHQIPAGDVVGASTEGSALRIWHMPLANPGGDPKRKRRLRKTPLLHLGSAEQAGEAAQYIRRACCWQGRQQPPRLVVLINPASGPGRGPSIYERDIRPVFEAAGLHVTAHVTKAQGHATEIVQQLSASSCDALVAIGGDGTMFEVLQGMLARPDWDSMRRLPFAQIPCGSGNALAACTGMWTVPTAVHAVLKAWRQPLDIASVLQPGGRRWYSFLSLNFGLITNLDIGTEHLRWMGGTRFVVGGLQQILLKRSHRCRVALLEAPEAAAGTGAGTAAAALSPPPGPTAAAAAANGSSSGDGGSSSSGGVGGVTGAVEGRGGSAAGGGGTAMAAAGPPLVHTSTFGQLEEHAQLGEMSLPPRWQWLGDEEVQLFTACNLPMLDMNFHLAPEAAPASGHMNLIYTPPMSRMRGLQVMNASEKGQHMALVQQRKLVAMLIEPRSSGTWLVVDGEALPFGPPTFLEVHPQLCSVLTAPPPAAHASQRPD